MYIICTYALCQQKFLFFDSELALFRAPVPCLKFYLLGYNVVFNNLPSSCLFC